MYKHTQPTSYSIKSLLYHKGYKAVKEYTFPSIASHRSSLVQCKLNSSLFTTEAILLQAILFMFEGQKGFQNE